MEILIEEIPEEGLTLSTSRADEWLEGLMNEVLGDSFTNDDTTTLSLSIQKVDKHVTLDGILRYSAHRTCDRCLARFPDRSSVEFSTLLAPLYESKRQQEREEGIEVELVKEDLEFGYYEGDRFDLKEIVREQILLQQPMKFLCGKECKGLCPTCGKELNSGPCGCKRALSDKRWEVLKGIKINR